MENILLGLEVVFTWYNILAIVTGVFIGMCFGLTPGLDATSGTALLVAFTFGMGADTAILLLLGLYIAATYAGSITAITIGTPGTAAAAATVLDGYELRKQGDGGKALVISIVASTIGGIVGSIALVFITIPVARFAIKFGPPEYFALALLGLTIIAGLIGEKWIKGIMMVCVGLLITVVGLDPFTGYARFTFGVPELMEGISYIPALLGLFAISESLFIAENIKVSKNVKEKIRNTYLSLKEWKTLAVPISLSSIIGTFIGALPGAGAATANWIAYGEAKRVSKNPHKFGKGAIEGLAAAETANNATVSSSLIPLLGFGIPGTATAAVLLGALMLHGIIPGPQIFDRNIDLVYGMFVGLFIINMVMLIFGLLGVRLWTLVMIAPPGFIVATIFAMGFIGSYALRNSLIDVWIMIAFGLLGYVLRKFDFPIVPIVIALVLGFLVQDNFRRSMILSDSGAMIFIERPISLVLLTLCILSLIFTIVKDTKQRKKGEEMGA